MINCGRVEKLLSAYLEKELGPHLQKAVEDHIKFCTQCLAKEESLKSLLSLSHSLEVAEPSFGFTEKLEKKIAHVKDVPANQGRSFILGWNWRLGLAIPLALLLLAVGVTYQLKLWPLSKDKSSNLASQPIKEAEPMLAPVATDGPVEFVMDNWDQNRLQNLQATQTQDTTFRTFYPEGYFFPGEQNGVRVYVMPVQNQMATYRQPY